MKHCLVIFAKEPEKGKVKTRLKDYLSKIQCLNLYKAFLKDTIDLTKKIQCEIRIIAYDSDNKNPRYLKRIAPHFRFYKQKGKNLGERMHNTFKFAKENKTSKTVIIGSDSPNLPAGFIKKTFRGLDKYDVVLGPSLDGGYYLIGLKRPCFGLFKNIKWSSNKVLDNTIRNCRRLKKKMTLLDIWYDVDEPVSLMHLKKHLQKEKEKKTSVQTKKFLKIWAKHIKAK